MEKCIHYAKESIMQFVNPKDIDNGIPIALLKHAKGIVFITEFKAGFMWSGMIGGGIVLARKKDSPNEWSGPVALGTGGLGWGAQIGGSKTNAIIVLNSYSAIKAFAGQAQVKLGGDLSVAAGPVGRTAAADVRVGKGVTACYSYSHSQGLFAGVALEGAVLFTLDKENHKFYGSKVTPRDILYGDIKAPTNSDLSYIYETLNNYSYNGGGEIREEETQHPVSSHVAHPTTFGQPSQSTLQPPLGGTPPPPGPPSSLGSPVPEGEDRVEEGAETL
jgi:lipid-binding SYLF domain-containing protein